MPQQKFLLPWTPSSNFQLFVFCFRCHNALSQCDSVREAMSVRRSIFQCVDRSRVKKSQSRRQNLPFFSSNDLSWILILRILRINRPGRTELKVRHFLLLFCTQAAGEHWKAWLQASQFFSFFFQVFFCIFSSFSIKNWYILVKYNLLAWY